MEIDPQNTIEEKNLTQQPNMETIQPTNEEDEERTESMSRGFNLAQSQCTGRKYK
jgi:hypothetical protein